MPHTTAVSVSVVPLCTRVLSTHGLMTPVPGARMTDMTPEGIHETLTVSSLAQVPLKSHVPASPAASEVASGPASLGGGPASLASVVPPSTFVPDSGEEPSEEDPSEAEPPSPGAPSGVAPSPAEASLVPPESPLAPLSAIAPSGGPLPSSPVVASGIGFPPDSTPPPSLAVPVSAPASTFVVASAWPASGLLPPPSPEPPVALLSPPHAALPRPAKTTASEMSPRPR